MAELEFTRQGAIAAILINRPAKKNALRDQDFVAFTAIARAVAASDARCVLIAGAGGSFCAGRDIATTDVATLDAETLIRAEINPLFLALRAISVPTIAAVDGPCVGGGFGIAFACDIVLAAEDARFGSPFRNIGSLPDSGTHYYLEQRLGYHRACELIFTGRFLSGQEAATAGLINRAYPAADLHAAARAMADDIAAGPTAAFQRSKQILQAGEPLGQVLDAEAVGQGAMFKTTDSAEGFAAFQQKRKPRFIGS